MKYDVVLLTEKKYLNPATVDWYTEQVLTEDGLIQEALEKLEVSFQKGQLPDLILLDINLPKLNGHEVLEQLKQNEHFKHVPVIILSTSSSEMDILKSYKNHANCFITKPVEIDEFVKAIESIEDFWFSIVKLPKQ